VIIRLEFEFLAKDQFWVPRLEEVSKVNFEEIQKLLKVSLHHSHLIPPIKFSSNFPKKFLKTLVQDFPLQIGQVLQTQIFQFQFLLKVEIL